jgi:hypothetical protein
VTTRHSDHAAPVGDRRLLLVTSAITLVLFASTVGAVAAHAAPLDEGASVWVAPDGSDDAAGTPAAPLRTVQAAIERAAPGTTIEISAGTYAEPLMTVAPGAPGSPITLRGHDAVLTGGGDTGRILQVRHDHWTIEGLELRGRDTAVWVEGAQHVAVRSNDIHDFRGECVRVKYLASDVVIARNAIHDCGLEDFVEDPGSGKNGEGVYIGTAPEQLVRNPTPVPDVTTGVIVRDNVIATRGNECVDIKEAATGNLVEFNDCTDQRDADSAGLDARGSGNVFRYNRSYGNDGAGIRLGGDTEQDGTSNDVIGNELVDNAGSGIKAMRLPQGRICGNVIERSGDGALNDDALDNPRCEADLPPAGPRTSAIGAAR